MRWRAAVLGLSIALAAACADEDLAPQRAARPPQPARVISGSIAGGLSTPPYVRYVVREGDTVESVAREAGFDPRYVLWNNEELIIGGRLLPGTTLHIPFREGILHPLRNGERIRLREIAAYYDVEPRVLLDADMYFASAGGTAGVILVPGGRKP